MSAVQCERCDWLFSSDDDPDCFVECGPRLRMTRILCEGCREMEQMIDEGAAAEEARYLQMMEEQHADQ